jgi:hypothetical protein
VREWLKIKPGTTTQPTTDSNTNTEDPEPDLVLKKIRVRRSKAIEKWVTTNETCTEITGRFACGLMKDVKFNNRAIPMNLFGQNTYADAVCDELLMITAAKRGHFRKPPRITYTARIYYAPSKGGIVIRNSKFVVSTCDFVLLNPDGTSTACWYVKPENAPPQETL